MPLIEELRGKLGSLPGARLRGLTVEKADDFAYHDPVERLGERASGHPRAVRGRLPRGLPAFRHRHQRGDACASLSSATSRTRQSTTSIRSRLWPT